MCCLSFKLECRVALDMINPACFIARPCHLHLPLPACWQQFRRSRGSWEVSSHGRVRNSLGQVSYGSKHPTGYHYVQIDKLNYPVHRLVAAAFLDTPLDVRRLHVNHCDGDPSNNAVSNLRYVTAGENMKHAWQTNLSRKPIGPKLGKAIEWRRQGEDKWSFCASHAEAARLLGVNYDAISQCCRGLRRTTGSRRDGQCFEFRWAPAATGSPLRDEDWRPASYIGDCNAVIANLMVSSHGRISHLLPDRQITSYGTLRKSGYFTIAKSGRALLVHRLVAATFLGQPRYPYLQVHHKDHDPGNNHVTNLEYVTHSENMRHAFARSVGQARKGPTSKSVQARCKLGAGSWQDFDSIRAAAATTGFAPWQVSSLCRQPKDTVSWEFRFTPHESLPGEEWRPVVFQGAQTCPLRSSGI